MIIDIAETKIERTINQARLAVNNPDLIGSEVVHKYEDKWWFLNEGWERMGPYETKKKANEACNEYARLLYASLLGESDESQRTH